MCVRINSIILIGVFLVFLGNIPEANAQVEIKEIVQREVDEIWNQGNMDVVDELFATDFVNHDSNPPGVTDLKGYKAWVVDWRAAFHDYHVEVNDLVAEGDKVGARCTVTGTHQGDFFTVPATGIQITMKMINIYRVADGKIAEVWRGYDLLGVGQQIGYYKPIPDFPYSFARRTSPEEFVWGPDSDLTGDPGDPESNKALIAREVVDGWGQGDAALALEPFAPTFVWHSEYPEVTDYESYVQWIKEHGLDPEDPTIITLEHMVAERDRVAVYSAASGGMLTGTQIYRFADGLIVEQWRTENILPAFIGMGLVPPFPAVSD